MNSADSEEIAQICHDRGFSVTSALNAALIRVTAQFPQDSEADSYVFCAPVDLRKPLIAAGATECMQPVGSYVPGCSRRMGQPPLPN
jgi:hypothetical protein